MSRLLPTARELLIATLAVLLALSVTNLVRPAEAGGGGPSTDVVFIATGENFPDALAAAAAAGALLAPVLLVTADSVPEATRDELNRLAPEAIIIVGGPAVVSDGVESTLEGLAFAPVVTRVSGANRYETAAALSAAAFPTQGLYPLAFHESDDQLVDVSTGQVMRSITLTAPTDGVVIVNSTATMVEVDAANEVGACSITTGSTVDYTHVQYWESAGTGGDYGQLSGTRGYDVSTGETLTVNLVCEYNSGTSGSILVRDSAMTAIFVADV